MTIEADVVVVGGGAAGLMCALAAADGGRRVLVLEAASRVGGTLHVSAGHLSAAGTRRQRGAGIDDHPDLHFLDVMRIGGGLADPALVRLAVDQAPGLVDWLDEQGFDFAPETPVVYRGHSTYSRPRTYWGRRNGLSILDTIKPRFESHVVEGRIDLRLSTRMSELLIEQGEVVGVRAVSENGADLVALAGATVLASGGYGSAEDLFLELTPGADRLVTNAIESARGDGLRAATAVGAARRFGELHTPRLGLLERRDTRGRVDFWSELMVLDPVTRPPREIWVNSRGARFTAEDGSDVTAQERTVLAQPGSEFWVVFDERALVSGDPLVRQWDADRLRAEASAGDTVWCAQSVEGLARAAGIDSQGLVATVIAYNAAVEKGVDPLGRKLLGAPIASPPYYAVRTPAALLCSFGGVSVDSTLAVRRLEDTTVRGLFAVGEVIGMGATSGAAFCGGMALTPALALGRWLGRRIAGEV